MKDKQYCKVRDHCYYTEGYRDAPHSKWNLKGNIPEKSCIAFHNGSNYDYHFIIKVSRGIWKKNHVFGRKHWQVHNLYNRKRNYKNWLNCRRNYKKHILCITIY